MIKPEVIDTIATQDKSSGDENYHYFNLCLDIFCSLIIYTDLEPKKLAIIKDGFYNYFHGKSSAC